MYADSEAVYLFKRAPESMEMNYEIPEVVLSSDSNSLNNNNANNNLEIHIIMII